MEHVSKLITDNWLTLIVAVLGLLATYFFYRRSITKHQIAFQRESTTIIGIDSDVPSDIEIVFRGTRVPLVQKSEVAIWNRGNATISGNQIVEKDALRIELTSKALLLDFSITLCTRKVNAFTVTANKNRDLISCNFDFLDPGDGVLITVLHTGKDVNVVGTIRSMPKGLLDLGRLEEEEPRSRWALAGWIVFGLLAMILMTPLFYLVKAGVVISWSEFWNSIASFGFALLFLIYVIYILTKWFRPTLPKELSRVNNS